jgi:hypothetical protein
MPRKSITPNRICETCGKSFKPYLGNIKKGGGRFCSPACSSVAKRIPAVNRFWHKVNVLSQDECWLFHAGMGSNKRGIFKIDGKEMYASRAAWIITNGPVPDGLWVLHKCDCGSCCNPSHLFLGTPADNVHDMYQKGRQNILRGDQDPKSKLTEDDVREIRRLYKPYVFSQFKLAAMFKVRRTTIQSVLNGSNWSHVK